jgi:3-phosphoglycerate kinase
MAEASKTTSLGSKAAVSDIDLDGQRVIIRVDFNVPFKDVWLVYL